MSQKSSKINSLSFSDIVVFAACDITKRSIHSERQDIAYTQGKREGNGED